jgi:peptidoglycan/xylan/chitin deacetylase (PgdA/CDA1 family)
MTFKHNLAKFLLKIIQGFLRVATSKLRLNKGLTVFLFHSVTDEPSEFLRSAGMWTSTKNFKNQIDWINKNFSIVSVTSLSSQGYLPPNSAIITFDDAWLGSFEAIKNILIPEKIPVCFFVNFGGIIEQFDIAAVRLYLSLSERSDRLEIEPTNLLESALAISKDIEFTTFQGPLMTLSQSLELIQSNLVTIGNHLYHHLDANTISDFDFLKQLQLNQELIESNGATGRFFSFPFGAPGINFRQRHLTILKNESFNLVFSANSNRLSKFVTTPPYIPRIHFSPSDMTPGDFWWATFKNQVLRRNSNLG